MKKVLLVVVDALASRVVGPAMEQGRLPHFAALAQAGRVHWDCTAIFPSITPAATAALVTGMYPAHTGVTGAYFYDSDEDRVHYYGDDTWAILGKGISKFFEDFLVHLNRDQLRSETIFQKVERAGMRAGCLNYLWYRGDLQHQVRVPWLLSMLPGIERSKTVLGPSLLSLGDFVSDSFSESGKILKGPGGLFRRYGFNDGSTAAQLLMLAQERAFPDFTVAYFPDNDFDSHHNGPQAALTTVEKVDKALGELMASYGGIDPLLESLAIVITGDHAQSDLPLDQQETGILLDDVLREYSIVPAGENWGDGDQLLICPNMRAAQIYLRHGYWDQREAIIQDLLGDERIDQVIWREAQTTGECHFFVQTARHGKLEFWIGEGGQTAVDAYGNPWSWKGALASVGGQIGEQSVIEFEDYPNALERIAATFSDSESGDIWVTSHLGYEFRLDAMSVHRRGSHGSLHKQDSLSPLILAGVPESLCPRQTPRSVDVVPLCLSLLELTGSFELGAGHLVPDRASLSELT
jgi:hypothetical protein